MRSKLIAALAAAVSVSLVTVACSASTAPAPRSAAGHVKAKHSAARIHQASRSARLAGPRLGPGPVARAPVPGAFDRPFGTGCAQLPRTGGVGSPRGLPRVPVATAMAQTPILSELVHAIRLAGLSGMLNTAHALTVFAPDNAAFEAFGTSNLQALYGTRSDLVRVLKFQIVAGRVRPAELARERVLTTLGGTKLYPAKAGLSYNINNASVSCGNLRTANATVYIVNRLIVPAT
ncbi:MAG: fasciclin domain-containing protein [Streptosporangiaceae bacterium]